MSGDPYDGELDRADVERDLRREERRKPRRGPAETDRHVPFLWLTDPQDKAWVLPMRRAPYLEPGLPPEVAAQALRAGEVRAVPYGFGSTVAPADALLLAIRARASGGTEHRAVGHCSDASHGSIRWGGYCAVCGARVIVEDDETRFCPGCGRVLSRPTNEEGDE